MQSAYILSGRLRHRLFVAAVLTAAFVLRILLVTRGGQHFFFDETRFGASTGAAALLSKGDVMGALAFAMETHPGILGDHFGFKLIGIIPELIEGHFGRNEHIPAFFLSLFSTLCILVLAAIAYRLSASLRAFDFTLIAASLSATLLIYSRFILPYDLSMCVALLAIWIGVRQRASYLRSAFVGALGAWTFFCYYGYWPLAGAAILLPALWHAESPYAFLKRLATSAIGGIAVVSALYGISRLGNGALFKDMAEIAGLQAGGPADFRASLNSWAYLFSAEKISLFVWVAPFAAALFFEIKDRPAAGRKFVTPLMLAAAGFMAVYSVFVLDSDIRHSLIVSGRHLRQLAPFLILGFGLGLDRMCDRLRFGGAIAAAAVAVLFLNSFATFSVPLSQEFPRDFRSRAETVLKSRPAVTDGTSYYRLVNVDHFVIEPEILRDSPVETLLVSPHPLQYLPYLYDGAPSREMKKLRLAIDHRMRLVRMAVPESERIHGDDYGEVKLSVELPEGRAGYTEPLLSVGPKGNGDLFFVNYTTSSTAVLGYINMGRIVLRSKPFEYTPGKLRVFELFSGSLMPADDRPIAGMRPVVADLFRETVYATVDGSTLIDELVSRHLAQPGQVFAGVNVVEADSAGDQFRGEILNATRGGWPPVPKEISKSDQFGPVHLKVIVPPSSNGTAEPLVVAGIPGHAVLGYMRIFQDGSVCFGIEIWGIGSFEGKRLSLAQHTPVEVEYSFGSLFPDVGLTGWNGLSIASQQELKHTVKILVDGEVALDLRKDTPDLRNLPVYYGKNPIGGSLVNAGFSGQVLTGFRANFGK